MNLGIWFNDKPLTLKLVRGELFFNVAIILIYLFLLIVMMMVTHSVRKLRRVLSEGSSIIHDAPWRKHRRAGIVFLCIIFIPIAMVAIIPWIQIATDRMKTLPMDTSNLPIIRLSDLEETSEMVRDELFYDDSIDLFNSYNRKWSVFVSNQYVANEHLIYPTEPRQKDRAGYSPSIRTETYKLNFPYMRENLLIDLIQIDEWRYVENQLSELESEEFDSLFIRQDDIHKEIFAAKGKAVMYVSYYGNAEIDTIITSIEEKMKMINK